MALHARANRASIEARRPRSRIRVPFETGQGTGLRVDATSWAGRGQEVRRGQRPENGPTCDTRVELIRLIYRFGLMHKSLDPSVTLMTSWWYRHYVLGLLFLSYSVNLM